MPDPVLIVTAMGVAAAVSAVLLFGLRLALARGSALLG